MIHMQLVPHRMAFDAIGGYRFRQGRNPEAQRIAREILLLRSKRYGLKPHEKAEEQRLLAAEFRLARQLKQFTGR